MIQGVPRTYLGNVMKSRDIPKWLSGLNIFFSILEGWNPPPYGIDSNFNICTSVLKYSMKIKTDKKRAKIDCWYLAAKAVILV